MAEAGGLGALVASPSPPRQMGRPSRSWRVGKGVGVARQNSFVQRAQTVTKERNMSIAIASYLPTGLLTQLHDAVVHEGHNPRVPQERPGVYLCLHLTGLHSLSEMPLSPQSRSTS